MDLDIVNITKIKDGFFLGDEATAANLDVIIQFKITHMINAAGTQIINAWESIGIKYLTLNWSENPNQNLFDQKDEIATRIVSFIEEAIRNGEGILLHSLRGQNRACIVVIIYFIKKYSVFK
jgi:protein-tyrosine phosphatase